MSEPGFIQYDGPNHLLAQLKSGDIRPNEKAPLVRGDDKVWARSIHVAVLENMLWSDDGTEFEQFKDCMEALLELKLFDEHMSLNDSARLFADSIWLDDREYVCDLMRRFIELDFLKVNEIIPGELDSQDCERSVYGMKPLAAAIFLGHPDAVRILDAAGASWNLGPVIRDGQPRMAVEFAQECSGLVYGAPEVFAYFTEKLMTQRIDAILPGPADDSNDTPRPGRRARL
ncbi:hypothetical protein [Paucibacter soli]|uniref:hypothetical protein n=1 Tax=Paucibacter soli TaxID=3133433 RepID=UPI00309B8E8A